MLFVKSLHLSNLVFLLARAVFGCKDKNGVIMCNGGEGSHALSFDKYLMRTTQ